MGRLQQEELHNYERPISLLAYQNAEINRDRKKQRAPNKIEDFYFYSDKDLENLPKPKYGAAAMALIKQRIFPGWALFVYKDLKERAGDALPPELLCVQCKDAIVLAPSIEDMTMNGLLIAEETASGQTRLMTSPCGLQVEAVIPILSGKFEAIEGAELKVIRFAKNAEL